MKFVFRQKTWKFVRSQNTQNTFLRDGDEENSNMYRVRN